ncbi:mucin-like protein 3 [Sarcophilus harrisii]|uniref:mucin-like protein 3 n=1 Tax=Sarcophilus harrisii TaxID=9305 RepID=UPI000C7D8BCE|nr:mucin-like protein 3 [Sarcophilus harrisii]
MGASSRTISVSSKLTASSQKERGTSFRTISVSPKPITTYHEEIGTSDRTTSVSFKNKTTSHEDIGILDRTTTVSPKTITTYYDGMGTTSRSSKNKTTSHEGIGTLYSTTTVSLKITNTSHTGRRTSIIGDLKKTTQASNRVSLFEKTTDWIKAVSDKVTESLGTSYKPTSASDKTIGAMEPTTVMGNLDKTITFGGTSEKMVKSFEKTTGLYKTKISSYQTQGALDKTIQISDKTTKASGGPRPLDKTTHKSTSTPYTTLAALYPSLQVTSEKTFAPFTTLNYTQELNSTKSINNYWPDQKTDKSRGGSQNGATQGVLEGNSFPAWAIVIVVLVAVIFLLLLIGLLFMAPYIIRTRQMTTDHEENDAKNEIGPNSYPVFLMEQQTLGRSQLLLP